MKRNFYLLLTVAAVAFNFACGGSTATETTKTNTANIANQSTTTNTVTTKPATTAAATVKNSTPTEAGETFFNAVKTRDKATFRQMMSKDSIEILEAAAQVKKMTLEGLLDKEFFPNTPMPDKCEQRNEKITGDKATTEMKDEKGEWSPMTFVKEGSAWKVSLE